MNRDHLGIVITVVCILVLMAVVSTPEVSNHGYVVEPATEEDIAASTPLETTRITFWDLPPRIMLISVITSISPLLVFPVELFFFLKGIAFLGYRKITTSNVLGNPVRLQIYEMIKANPGIYFNELSRKTGFNRGTVRYHLALMSMTGKVSVLTIAAGNRYFENSGKFSETEQKVLNFLRNRRDRAIFEYLVDHFVATRSDLETVLGISGPAVTWHMNRLRDAGLLTVERTGKTIQYTIDPETRKSLGKYLGTSQENPEFSFPA